MDEARVAAIAARIEAVLLSVDKAVAPQKLAEALSGGGGPGAEGETGGPEGDEEASVDVQAVHRAVESLNGVYERTGRSFRIESVAGGLRVMTLPEHAGVIARFQQSRQSQRLSKPALETLAIIAYRQPITRADLEAIRGVSCGEVLKSLLERKLVTITGRAEVLGRPMLYGTTKQFLDTFGLGSVKDLPKPEELAIGS